MFRLKRILVPCDFSRFSDAAIHRACDLAASSNAELHLLHVLADPPLFGRPEPEADRLRQAQQRLDQQLAPHVLVEHRVERAVATGAAHRAICRYAQEHDIDLIVIATHGRTGLAYVAVGSVTEKVLAAAPCPVLVVRHPDQEESLVERAARVLRDEFGEEVSGEFGETRASFKGRLMRLLNVSEQAADYVVEKLRAEETLVWNESPLDAGLARKGRWRIEPAAAAISDTPQFVAADEISPAIDLITRGRAL